MWGQKQGDTAMKPQKKKPELKLGEGRHRGSCVDLVCAVGTDRKTVFKCSGAGSNVAGSLAD